MTDDDLVLEIAKRTGITWRPTIREILAVLRAGKEIEAEEAAPEPQP